MTAQPHRIVHVDDVQPNRRRGGDLRAMLTPTVSGSTSGFMGVAILQRGERIAEHYHPYSEEFLLLVEGVLTVRLDGQDTVLEAGAGVFIPIGTRHRLMNDSAAPAFGVFHLSPLAPRPDLGHVDTEVLPHP